jgi:hypothetical protein
MAFASYDDTTTPEEFSAAQVQNEASPGCSALPACSALSVGWLFVNWTAFYPLGGFSAAFLRLFLRREITLNAAACFHVTYTLR